MKSTVLQPACPGEIRDEAARQLGRPVDVQKVHISFIRQADTVFHDGRVRTVCGTDLKRDDFMGRTLFGDSYVLGRKPVMRIAM